MEPTRTPRNAPRPRAARPLAERFWEKVDKTETCWLWTARLNASGYGTIKIVEATTLAHRVAFQFDGSTIPEGMLIDHICRVRHCVRPSHLRVVTKKQNCENRTGAQPNSASGIRGVFRDKKHGEWTGKWQAQLKHNGEVVHLGRFKTVEEASEAARIGRLERFTHNDLDAAPQHDLRTTT